MLFQTLFIYSSLIVVMFVCGVNVVQKSKLITLSNATFSHKSFLRYSIFIFLYFAVLVGLRYDVGTDHLHYLSAYEEGSFDRFEFLFALISNVCKLLDVHPTIYFGIFGFIQIVFFYYAFKEECYLFPLFAVFLFTDGLFGSWMNTIRQDIACCIWIFALNYIVKQKPIQYVFFCFLAFLFHKSAIILVALYPVFKNGKDYLHNIPFQLGIIIVAFLLKNSIEAILIYFDQVYSLYSLMMFGDPGHQPYSMESMIYEIGENGSEVSQTGIGVIVKYITYICIVLFSNMIKNFYNSSKVNVIYTLFFVSLILYIILPAGVYGLARPFQYFNCTRMIMLSYLVFFLFNNKNDGSYRPYHKIIGMLILFTQIGLFFVSNIISAQSVSYHGYQLYFQR